MYVEVLLVNDYPRYAAFLAEYGTETVATSPRNPPQFDCMEGCIGQFVVPMD